LEEWARAGSTDEQLQEESRRARERLLGEALADVAANRHDEVIGPLFEGLGSDREELARRIRESSETRIRTAVSASELRYVLDRLAGDIYRSPHLRREARRFKANPQLGKELADALTILVADLRDWDWPAEGLATRALWTRNKWRLYLDEDLPTACLLEIL